MAETTPLLGTNAKKTARPPFFLALRSSKWFIIFAITLALFTDTMLYAVVVPVFPFTLKTRAGIPPDDIQWWQSFLFALFGAVGLVFSPICGYFADRTTVRQLPIVFGLVMAIAGTVLFGVAKEAWLLAASRICQAMASTIVFSVGLAVISDTVPKGEVGQSMGIALSGVSIGYIVSPTLGGIVYEHSGYAAVFVMCAGLLAFDVILQLAMIEKKTAMKYLPQDEETTDENQIEGAGETTGDVEQPDPNATPGPLNPVAAIKAYRKERRLPLVIQFFVTPRFFAAFWGYCVYVALLGAYDCVLALYVKRRFGWSPMLAGLIYLPLAVPNLTAPLVGHWAEKMNARLFAIIGFAIATPLQALLLFVDQEGSWEIWVLCVLLTLVGCAMTLIGTPLASEMSDCVSEKEKTDPAAFEGYSGGGYAQAFSLLNVANSVGLLVGPAFAGSLIDAHGWKPMCVGLAILTFSGAIPSIALELLHLKKRVVATS